MRRYQSGGGILIRVYGLRVEGEERKGIGWRVEGKGVEQGKVETLPYTLHPPIAPS